MEAVLGQWVLCDGRVEQQHQTRTSLKLSPRDNVLVALSDLRKGDMIAWSGSTYTLASDVPAKHKFATENLAAGSDVIMYGVLVGKAVQPIAQGEVLTPEQYPPQAARYHEKNENYRWTPPDVSRWRGTTFRDIGAQMAKSVRGIIGLSFRWCFARTET